MLLADKCVCGVVIRRMPALQLVLHHSAIMGGVVVFLEQGGRVGEDLYAEDGVERARHVVSYLDVVVLRAARPLLLQPVERRPCRPFESQCV